MADKIRVLLNEEEVDRRIKEIAEQINKDYEGKAVHLICILKGGVFFTCELAKRLTVPVTLDLYVRVQLRQRHRVLRRCKDHQRSGPAA